MEEDKTAKNVRATGHCMSAVTVLSASAAIQQSLVFHDFESRAVNRVAQHHVSLAGKGTNAARVAASLGARVTYLTCLDKKTAKWVQSEALPGSLEIDAVCTKNRTRICTTLLGPDSIQGTELVQESEALSKTEAAEFEQRAMVLASNMQRGDVLVLTGSIPRGIASHLYRDIVRRTDACVVLDAHSEPLRLALEAADQLSWIKPNLTEWETLCSEMALPNPMSAAEHLPGFPGVMLSDGPRAVRGFGPGSGRWKVSPIGIEVRNPIGSGDSVTGGLAYALASGMKIERAIRIAIASGIANCETIEPGVISRKRVIEISDALVVEDC